MIWIALSLAMAGLVLVIAGSPRLLRRRDGDAPTCARCEYDLTGLAGEEGDAKVCPECGSELSKAGAVVKGRRARRRKAAIVAVLIGAIMFLAGTGLGGSHAWRWSQSYDWNKVKPVWLLHAQAKKSTATSGVAVLDELIARLDAAKLGKGAVESIIETVLARQVDLATPWNKQWGDFASVASKQQLITEDQEQSYLAGVVVVGAEVRPWVYPGEPVPVNLILVEARCGAAERFYAQITIKEAHIGDKELNYQPFWGGLSTWIAGTGWSTNTSGLLGSSERRVGSINRSLSDPEETPMSSQVTAPEQLGPAQLRISWQILIVRDDDGERSMRTGHFSRDNGSVAATDSHHILDFEIVEPGTHPITTRPGNDGVVIAADELRFDRFRRGNTSANGRLTFQNVDAAAGYDLVWILPADVAAAWQTDREWVVASYVFRRGIGSGTSTFGYNSNSIAIPEGDLGYEWMEGVQILLRPSARISRMTVDIVEIPADSTDLGIHRVPVIDKRRR